MLQKRSRLLIAATQSGSGKTTIVTGLLVALKAQGVCVQSYKVGPDYIDPGYHTLASGRACHNLDTWLTPNEKLLEIFARSSEGAEISIIEGVMGLYDGGNNGISSTAEIAKLLRAPVLLVVDAKSMGASAAALALGFKNYDPEVQLAGVILNRLGSDTHEAMIRKALEELEIPVFGALRRNQKMQMPERHLGLLPTEENEDKALLGEIAEAVSKQLDIGAIKRLAEAAVPIEVEKVAQHSLNKKVRIGVAKDEAFSFYYPESMRVLEQFGAEIIPFSPLMDAKIPEADGLIFGGGFPEIFAKKLTENNSMMESIRCAAQSGIPIYAECGGYMYLMEALTDFEGQQYPMVGILPGKAVMREKLQMVGYVEAELAEDGILGKKGTKIHGHEFHFSSEEIAPSKDSAAFIFKKTRTGVSYLAGVRKGNVIGSYLHLHFAGAENAAQSFITACQRR